MVLVLTTLVLWVPTPGFTSKFVDTGSIATAIGQMMRLVGLIAK